MPTHRKWGAVVQPEGGTTFRVWAPALPTLALEMAAGDDVRSVEMRQLPDGFLERHMAECGDGARYRYRLPGGACRPDPVSRFQPEGVHGWSQVVDASAYDWKDAGWRGVAKSDLIVYELHVGCFTSAGTYLAAIERLAGVGRIWASPPSS